MPPLTIVAITPHDGENNVNIDTTISIEFSEPIEPSTINYGIGVFTIGKANWYGADASIQDTLNSDVLDLGEEYNFIEGVYTLVQPHIVEFKASKSYKPLTKHYIQVLPGNDPSRYITKKTASDVLYTRAGSSVGTITQTQPYVGIVDNQLVLTFAANNTIDATADGVYLGEFPYVAGEPLSIAGFWFTVDGDFDINDEAAVDLYAPTGLESVFQVIFETSEYATTTIKSRKIDDELYKINYSDLKIVESMPRDLTVNNVRCNPVTVKFNRTLDPLQDLSGCVSVMKYDMATGAAYNLTSQAKVSGDTVKVYITGVDSTFSMDGSEQANIKKDNNLILWS